VDPWGLLSKEDEATLSYLQDSGAPDYVLASARQGLVAKEENNILSLESAYNSFTDQGASSYVLDSVMSTINGAEDDLLLNMELSDYNQVSDTVDHILNNRLADKALDMVGTNYVWSGKPDTINKMNGLDCSGFSEYLLSTTQVRPLMV